MAAKINRNRYRLITLLYIVFVCLSVLNIPANLLDSNLYTIKTFEFAEEQSLDEIAFVKGVISVQNIADFSDTALKCLAFSERVDRTYAYLNSIDSIIINEFNKNGTTIQKSFSSKRLIEKVLIKDSLVYKMRDSIFSLHKYLSEYKQLDELKSVDLIPTSKVITNSSGKSYSWEYFLFLHKPVAVSYQQLKRLKYLLLAEELFYLRKVLHYLQIQPAYYSMVTKKAYTQQSLPNPANMSDTSISKQRIDSLLKRQKAIMEELVKRDQVILTTKPQLISTADFANADTHKISFDSLKDNDFDDFFQQIINSLSAENMYAGIENSLIDNFSYKYNVDYALTLTPGAEVIQDGNNLKVKFVAQGMYKISFDDLRNGRRKRLFNKLINVSPLPTPIVRLNNEQSFKDKLNIKDLFYANGLRASVGLRQLNYFPGRVNGYRVTCISEDNVKQSVYNYGEIFQASTQEIITTLKKGDILLIDNVTVSLFDGSTRNANPLIFKISD